MSETLNLALSFTAIDAAKGVIDRLERRINALGDAGVKVQADFNSMRTGWAQGLQGLGIAWSGWRAMKPGVEAAASMEAHLMSAAGYLHDGHTSAVQIGKELKAIGRNAISVSQTMPISTASAGEFQNLLLRKSFTPDAIVGSAASALALARLRGETPENVGALMELFREQFGYNSGEKLTSALDWANKTKADPSEIYAALARTGQRLHSMGMGLEEAITVSGMLKGKVNRPGNSLDALLGAAVDTYSNPHSQNSAYARYFGLDFFKDNKFIGMAAMQEQLKSRFRGISETDRLDAFEKIFSGGAGAADALFSAENIKEFSDRARQRKGAADELNEQNAGLIASVVMLGNEWRNMMAQLYAPLLPAMVAPLKSAKTATQWIGDALYNHPVIAGTLGVAGAGVFGYGAYRAMRGFAQSGRSAFALGAGMRRFGIPLFGGVAGGLVADKAYQAITGEKSTSVFVTNWPPAMLSGSFGSAAGNVAGTAAGIAGGIGLKQLGLMAPLAALGAAPVATIALLTATALTSLGIGTLLRKAGDWAGDKTGIRPWDRLSQDMFDSAEFKARNTNHVQINLHVDANGRVLASSDDDKTSVDVSNGTYRGGWK